MGMEAPRRGQRPQDGDKDPPREEMETPGKGRRPQGGIRITGWGQGPQGGDCGFMGGHDEDGDPREGTRSPRQKLGDPGWGWRPQEWE